MVHSKTRLNWERGRPARTETPASSRQLKLLWSTNEKTIEIGEAQATPPRPSTA